MKHADIAQLTWRLKYAELAKKSADKIAQLEAENERLRKELERVDRTRFEDVVVV